MKIVADENIPFADELFSSLGTVELKPGRTLLADDVRDADILLVRSVTKVDRHLLEGSRVKFVGTCTIGTDHIDQNYLESAGIAFSSAPGCNAFGVIQYVFSILASLDKLDIRNKIGIVGCGNVGGRLYKKLKALGFECVCIDPHLDINMIPDLADFSALYGCDVICMHTPRIQTGAYPTEKLMGRKQFEAFKEGALLINAGRGECVDNQALSEYLMTHDDLVVALDVWAHEPNVYAPLIPYVKFCSPHIAGYSYEGRVNGSTMIFEALSDFLAKPNTWIDEQLLNLRQRHFGEIEETQVKSLEEFILHSYDPEIDHQNFLEAVSTFPSSFDFLRKSYRKRRELAHYTTHHSLTHRLAKGVDVLKVLRRYE